MAPIATIIAAIITASIVLIVGLIANNTWRQLKVKLSEQRQKAYASLRERTKETSLEMPTLDGSAHSRLFGEMTNWYYKDGNGMLVPAKTLALWRKVRANLICPANEFQPL